METGGEGSENEYNEGKWRQGERGIEINEMEEVEVEGERD